MIKVYLKIKYNNYIYTWPDLREANRAAATWPTQKRGPHE